MKKSLDLSGGPKNEDEAGQPEERNEEGPSGVDVEVEGTGEQEPEDACCVFEGVEYKDFVDILKRFPKKTLSESEFDKWHRETVVMFNESWPDPMSSVINCMFTDVKLRTSCIQEAVSMEEERREASRKYQKPWEGPVWLMSGWKSKTWADVYLKHPKRTAIRGIFLEKRKELGEIGLLANIEDPPAEDDFLSNLSNKTVGESNFHSADGMIVEDLEDPEPVRKIIHETYQDSPFKDEDMSSYTEVYEDDGSIVMVKSDYVEKYLEERDNRFMPKRVSRPKTPSHNKPARPKTPTSTKPVTPNSGNRGSMLVLGNQSINIDECDLDAMLAAIKLPNDDSP